MSIQFPSTLALLFLLAFLLTDIGCYCQANSNSVILSELAQRLIAQNAEGTEFFNMDDRGYPVPMGLDEVLDLRIAMNESDYQTLSQNASYLPRANFANALIVRSRKSSSAVATQQQDGVQPEKQQQEEEKVLLNLTYPGRIRPAKGQSALTMTLCTNRTPAIPFVLEFNRANPNQTLYGVEKLFLRSHYGDSSYMREWTAHRMLARFNLPHLRTRTVRFFINNVKIGLYTAMEAVDQDFVFYRSFPTVNFDDYALYKVKILSLGCGAYSTDELAAAESRFSETSTPPYAYQRGGHRSKVPVLGPDKEAECQSFYEKSMKDEFDDVILAYLRAGQDCGAMLVDQSIVDRDLGNRTKNIQMSTFINEHLAGDGNACNDAGCPDSRLVSDVDVDNWLKTFAVLAATLNQDSPMGNRNNYHLADRGDGTGWKMVIFDQNRNGDESCDPEVCNSRLVHWSIIRPTCASLESNPLVGPLLSNATLHAKYIEFVRSFVNTVAGNASFLEQIQQHGRAIQADAAQDSWGEGGVYFEDNLSLDPTLWNKNDGRSPLLPLLVARMKDIQEQLQALDAGTFPRGPHLDTAVEPYELCVDWRSVESDPSAAAQKLDLRFMHIMFSLACVSSVLLL